MMKAICVLYMYLYFLIMTTPSTIIIGGGGKVQLKNILRKISRGYDARPLSTGHNGAPNECQIMCTNINVKMFRLKCDISYTQIHTVYSVAPFHDLFKTLCSPLAHLPEFRDLPVMKKNLKRIT